MDYPTEPISLPKLKVFGFVPSTGVTLTIHADRKSNLKITATQANEKMYIFYRGGSISF